MLTDLRFKYFTKEDYEEWDRRESKITALRKATYKIAENERYLIQPAPAESGGDFVITPFSPEANEQIKKLALEIDQLENEYYNHIARKYDGHTADIIKDIKIIINDVTYEDFMRSYVTSFVVDKSAIKEHLPESTTEADLERRALQIQSRFRKELESYTGARDFLARSMVEYLLKALDYHGINRAKANSIIEKKAREWFPLEKFPLIRQGTATNILSKMVPNQKGNTTIDRITGTAKVIAPAGNATLTIPDFVSRAGFRTSTHQLLDALVLELTQKGAKVPIVSISLEQYMNQRGLKDQKEARKQVKADLQELFDAKFSFQEKRKNGAQDYHDIRIIDSQGIRKGVITVSFGTAFYSILLSYPLMPYPSQLWRLDNKRNPNSYYLLRRIAEHRNMNDGKKNADIIAVKTLLAAAPFLPTYEEVKNSDRMFRRRIIERFERDLDALESSFTWHYCHSNNTPLTDAELDTMDYELFESLNINVQWIDYPDQTERHERQAKKIEAAKSKAEKPAPKKKAGSGTSKGSTARKGSGRSSGTKKGDGSAPKRRSSTPKKT